MTQEEKDLLLKDLCARLPYGVKLDTLDGPQELNIQWLAINMCNIASPYLPYLFPLSSMTEEQKEELLYNYLHNDIYFDDFNDYFLAGELWHDLTVSIDALPELINWLNKNHFDYRGLIPMGLAIDATNLNIY